MGKPNPLILVMGAAPLAQVAGVVWGSKAPFALRAAGTAGCVLLAIACVTFAIFAYLHDKKKQRADGARALERKKLRSRRLKDESEAATDSGARPASAADRPSRDDS